MAQVYLKKSGSGAMKQITELLINKTDDSFQLNQLHNTTLPVYEGKTNQNKNYCINVKFKQLGNFMLITGKPLEKLAAQLFRRYNTNQQLSDIGITENKHVYQIDYSLIKQEMDRVYYESLMCIDYILQWEQKIVDSIPQTDKANLINECYEQGTKAYLAFREVCKAAILTEKDENELCNLRNHAMHAKIPETFSYHEKLNDNRIKEILQITDKMLEKYRKKDVYYEVLASMART
jgi:hypothetical protein